MKIAQPPVLAGFVVALAFAMGPGVAPSAVQKRWPREDADRMSAKLHDILQRAELTRTTPLVTSVTESEVNSYLHHYGAGTVPDGIADPAVSMLGEGRVAARAVVDLDAVRRARPPSSGWFDPSALLTGRLPVTAQGLLHATDGVGRIELESAAIAGIPVPKAVLQELVAHYSRSAERPTGVNLDDPFRLPARIQEIRVAREQAVVVQ